jgi:putative phosphoribosyl transferase
MKFKNRAEAAILLAKKLEIYRDKNPLVLGIPRGGMPMAKIVADDLNGELGGILVHKIPSPDNEEFAIAAIGLSGEIQRQPYLASYPISEEYLKAAAQKQLAVLQARYKRYGFSQPNYHHRIVIIVDDGIATGATVLAAIYEVRLQHPKKIIVAATVASEDSAEKIRAVADELVVLDTPEPFHAVGNFFVDFSEVTDEEVMAIFSAS